MTEGTEFVLAWTTSRNTIENEQTWVMVLHKERGWELPGGSKFDDEKFLVVPQAAIMVLVRDIA